MRITKKIPVTITADGVFCGHNCPHMDGEYMFCHLYSKVDVENEDLEYPGDPMCEYCEGICETWRKEHPNENWYDQPFDIRAGSARLEGYALVRVKKCYEEFGEDNGEDSGD